MREDPKVMGGYMKVKALRTADRAATNLGEELYDLDLQFFAEEGENGGQEGEGQTPPAKAGTAQQQELPGGEKTNSKTKTDSPANNGSGDDDDDDEKLIPQWKVNKLVTREVREAQEKLLKELGIEDFNSAKEGLQKFREWQDAQKSREEKQLEQFKKMEQQLGEFQTENVKLKAQIAALKAGVKSDSLEDVIVLANNLVNEDTSIDEAIQKVLKKYPQFKQTTDPAEGEGDSGKKPKFSSGTHQKQPQSEAEKWINIFKQI